MIQIKNLQKSYLSNNSKIEIFKNLSLDINSGDFISLIWPSWSWKSTLLNIISWIDRSFQWEIFLENIKINDLSDEEFTKFRWENISYIFQNFKLIDNLTVAENIDLIVELNNLKRNFSTDEILKIVWLADKKDNYVFNLSGWECQRVAIARAFVGQTKILLADEPTGALDIVNKKIIMDLILKLHNQIKNTIIMITHDDEVAKLADKVYKISNQNLILTN